MPLQARRPRPTGLQAAAPAPMPPLQRALALVGPDMAAAEAALEGSLASIVPAVSTVAHYLVDAGGKRLRPLITALGARAVGHTGDLVPLLCAGEILHLGSLLHDDVVDGGLERRGRVAAHRVYGNAAAVLAGDFCLARAVMLAAEGGGQPAVVELSRVVTRMAEGEVSQLLHAGRFDLDLPQYYAIIEAKSAALIAWCASAGALALGDAPAAAALTEYGSAVGVAFQLTDDVLDYNGDAARTGKQPGADLLEGKLTLPLLLAIDRDPPLGERLRAGPVTRDELPALLARVAATGACDETLQQARDRVEAGIKALHGLPPSAHRDALEALAFTLVERAS